MISINGPLRIYNELIYASKDSVSKLNSIIINFSCSILNSVNHSESRFLVIPILGKIESVYSYTLLHRNIIFDIFECFEDSYVDSIIHDNKSTYNNAPKDIEWLICNSADKIQQRAIETWQDEAVFSSLKELDFLKYMLKGLNYNFVVLKIPYFTGIKSFAPIEITYLPHDIDFEPNNRELSDFIDYDHHYIPLVTNVQINGILSGIPNFNNLNEHPVIIAIGDSLSDIDVIGKYDHEVDWDLESTKRTFKYVPVLMTSDTPTKIHNFCYPIQLIKPRKNQDIIVPIVYGEEYMSLSTKLSNLCEASNFKTLSQLVTQTYLQTNIHWLKTVEVDNNDPNSYLHIPIDLLV